MPTEPSLLPANWQVPSQFRARLGNEPGRQRIMQADGHLLIVLHAPPGPDDETRQGRFFWRDPQGNWTPKGLRHGEHALRQLLDEYDQVLDHLDTKEEGAATADDYFELLRALNPLVRTINNLHDTLQKAREAVPDDRQLLMLRDAAYALARRGELLYSDTRHALDYHIALRAEEQAESSRRMSIAAHRLNLLVAFFFPVATLAGVFGMNIHSGLEEPSRRAAPGTLLMILGLGLLTGLALTVWVTLVPKRAATSKRTRIARRDSAS